MSSNDNFADRIDLGSGTSANETFTYTGSTLWWSWTPEQTGWARILLESDESFVKSSYSSLSIFSYNALNNLIIVHESIGGTSSSIRNSNYTRSVGFWAAEGTEYKITFNVKNFGSDRMGEVYLNLEQNEGSINDNFVDRRDLGDGTSATDTGIMIDFTSELGEPLPPESSNSAWWSWTAPETGWVFINTTKSWYWTPRDIHWEERSKSNRYGNIASVFVGETFNSLTPVNQIYLNTGIAFWAIAGTEYQIAGYSYENIDKIELNLEQDLSFVPHDNDNFADRRNLGSGTSATDTIIDLGGFTSEPGEPSQSGEIKSAWWSWTPSQTGLVVIDTSFSGRYVSVFTGDGVDNLTVINQNSPKSSFWATAGTEYQIAVNSYGNSITGEMQLNLEQDLSFIPNDNFADRRDLGTGISAFDTGINAGFTSESGEPSQSGTINSAWWSWTAPETGWVVIDARHYSHYVSVFTGNAVDSLTLVNQNRAALEFWATIGTEYQIAVDSYQNKTHEIYLDLEYMISLIWQKDNNGDFIISHLDKTRSSRHRVNKEDFLLNRQNQPASLNDNWNVYQANLMGTDETDLLLQNKISGKFQIWELEGNKIVGNHYVTNASTNRQPQINDNWDVLTGNFTGTHQDDLLLKNKLTGSFSLWEMEDNFIIGTHTITRNGKAVQLNNNHNWDLIVGNFVGSEHDDILLRNKTSGNLQVWEIHNKEIVASHKIINPIPFRERQISLNQNWLIFSTKFGSGDRDNILLQNKISGGLQVWDMDGNQLAGITHLTDLNYSDSSLVI